MIEAIFILIVVVQSDHSAQQPQINQITLTPRIGTPPHHENSSPKPTTTANSDAIYQKTLNPVVAAPPIPPRAHTVSPSQTHERSASSASSSTASSSALFHNVVFPTMTHKETPLTSAFYHQNYRNSQQSRASTQSLSKTHEERSQAGSAQSNDMNQMATSVLSDADNTLQPESKSPVKIEESTSPTFMSSPEDDISKFKS